MKFLCVFSTFLLGACVTSPENSNESNKDSTKGKELVILHTNDFHGHPLKFFHYPMKDVGGLPAQKTMVDGVREKNKNVLVLSAGDINTGRPESNFFKAEPDFIGHSIIGYDAMSIGNHEFDVSMETLKKQEEIATFPFISANIVKEDGSRVPFIKPYTVKKFDGFSVAILGLTTKDTGYLALPEQTKGLAFQDEVKTANYWVPKLKKNHDMVIVLGHLGIYEGTDRGSKRVAANVPGIDLIIDGHSHDSLEKPLWVENKSSNKKIPIVQVGRWGLNVGKVKFVVSGEGTPSFDSYSLVTINHKEIVEKDGKKIQEPKGPQFKEDPELLAKLQPYQKQVDKVLSEVIWTSPKVLKETRHDGLAELKNLVADSMLWFGKQFQADFALQNLGGIRASLPEGKVRKKDIYEILPFDNAMVVMELTGAEVKKMFEYIATLPEDDGAKPALSGAYTKIDRKNDKVLELKIRGEDVKDNNKYRVITNTYVASGGDGYDILEGKKIIADSGYFQRDTMISFLQKSDNIMVDDTNRVEYVD